jgi:hypothetical protein
MSASGTAALIRHQYATILRFAQHRLSDAHAAENPTAIVHATWFFRYVTEMQADIQSACIFFDERGPVPRTNLDAAVAAGYRDIAIRAAKLAHYVTHIHEHRAPSPEASP